MTFSEICLSRSELKLLKRLEKNQKYIEACESQALSRLYALGFCKKLFADSPEHGNPIIIEIMPLGLDYLRYRKNQALHHFVKCVAWFVGVIILPLCLALLPHLLSFFQNQ